MSRARRRISESLFPGYLDIYELMYMRIDYLVEKYRGRGLDEKVIIEHLKSIEKSYSHGLMTRETAERHQKEYMSGIIRLKDFPARVFNLDPKKRAKDNPALDFLIYALMYDLTLIGRVRRTPNAFIVSDYLQDADIATLTVDAVQRRYSRLKRDALYVEAVVRCFCEYISVPEVTCPTYLSFLLHSLEIKVDPRFPRYEGPYLLHGT